MLSDDECWKMMPDNVILLLIGGGELESEYKNTVEATQLNNVIIEPFHPMEELMQFYRAADVFVHPTSYDVWGLVVNEAMASGLPCVVSDHCVAGLELIKDGVNGYLTEMGREDIICQRVLQIFNDKKLHDEMAINALETIKGYTIENMAEMQIRAIDLMVQE